MSYYVSAHNQKIAFQCLFAQQILWCFATALVRISVACSLLRLGTSRLWRWSLYGMIVLQIVTYLGFLVFLLGHASDIRANWEPVPTATWWDRTYEVTYGWVANGELDTKYFRFGRSNKDTGLMIGLDFTLALMPIRLIWTLHRTLREKILICCLMAMGLVATGIAAYKMTLSTKFQKGDLLSATVQLSLWNRLEELVGMSAACMPSLKAPAERFLLHIGVLAKQAGVSRPSFVMSLAEVRPQESQPVDSESQAFDSLQSHEDAYRKETLRTESKDSGSSKEVDISVP